MGLFSKLGSLMFLRRPPQSSASIAPSSKSTQATPTTPSIAPNPAPAQKSLAELEQEIMAQYAPHVNARPIKSASPRSQKRSGKKLMALLVLMGIPAGALWVINQPYPPIRRPIARSAPILLLPSYVSMDHSYREAIDLVEQAKQLVDASTSPADIELGTQKVAEAKLHLDKLPLWLWDELPGYGSWWWYGRLSYAGFNSARAEIGRLEAKTFQERNAQTALVDAEQAINAAKQQYQQVTTAATQQVAITEWRSALDQLGQVPAQTLAGRMAQQKLASYQREFQEVAGLAAGNQQTATYIEVARQYAWKAAQASQNPPHSVTEWQQVENMWQEAIQQLDRVPPEDKIGYLEAQKLRADYQNNLGQIQVRRQQEDSSVRALQSAQQKISNLQTNTPNDPKRVDRNYTIGQLQSIINELKQVENGTTAYLEAQQLLIQAQNKLNQLQK